jgi:hypothetical protein
MAVMTTPLKMKLRATHCCMGVRVVVAREVVAAV